MVCHCVQRFLEHVSEHLGVYAVGEGAVGAGSDQLNLVVPGLLVHQYVVVYGPHVEQPPASYGLPTWEEHLGILQESL